MSHFYDFEQLVARHILVLLVGVYHINQTAARLEQSYVRLVVLHQLLSARKVFDLERHIGIIGNVYISESLNGTYLWSQPVK